MGAADADDARLCWLRSSDKASREPAGGQLMLMMLACVDDGSDKALREPARGQLMLRMLGCVGVGAVTKHHVSLHGDS